MNKFNKLVIEIVELHNQSIVNWKNNQLICEPEGVLALIANNHFFNFQLWLAEDKARRDDMGYEFVYRAKRDIDSYNQQRNNLVESIDEWLVSELQISIDVECPIHSETPGLIIDRLSILALKIYHMQQQLQRDDVDDPHIQECTHKLNILNRQRNQLQQCLCELLQDVYNKKKTFCTYYQCKMYNDPKLNPELYTAGLCTL
ncbi:MAG: hypothetical protein A3E88_07180 [Legionellales bacterium RIFCSPHIGHO2_12_FULL_35_11]|nr:MAG: hypothetical protein A3E88_07180 [Legionellales bacterium RIFCSPHIGHO2_12_FULL_35_11]